MYNTCIPHACFAYNHTKDKTLSPCVRVYIPKHVIPATSWLSVCTSLITMQEVAEACLSHYFMLYEHFNSKDSAMKLELKTTSL